MAGHFNWSVVLAVCGALIGAAATLTPSSDYYTAGVVEFRPTIAGMSSSDLLADHLQAYLEIIHSPEANQTDILVFPEGTLNNAHQLTYVPTDVTPCYDASATYVADFLRRLSCAARDTRKYLLINLTEKSNCTDGAAEDPRPCAPDGLNVYNTNVVFDREGRIVSRYRKWNIYVEAKNTTAQVEYGMFDTDFGVRFGHFVCFDMLFYRPAEELVRKHGIRDIIFTSMFYSELPFLTAVQLQQSWSWGNNVNLLAAGSSYPQAGMTGSGIYAGEHGELISEMVYGEGVRKLLVAQVPKVSSPRKQFLKSSRDPENSPVRRNDIRLLRDPELDAFESVSLNTTSIRGQPVTIHETICDGRFCCSIRVAMHPVVSTSMENATFYDYRLGVFNGSRTYQKDQPSFVQVCALYACLNSSVSSCGLLFDDSVVLSENFVFASMAVEGDFEKVPELLVMPNTLTDRLKSLNDEEVEFNLYDERSFYHAHIMLKRPARNLLTFGIYANYYDRSPGGQASSQVISKLLIFILSSGLLMNKI